jgi:uncharacterized protein YjbJ (UPF0337 family)
MDREHIKGTTERVKGAAEEAVGKLTGDEKLRAEGKLDKAKGAAHKVVGDVKDVVHRGSKSQDK